MADELPKDTEAKSNKRSHAEFSEQETRAKGNDDTDSDSDSDDDIGPQLPSEAAATTAAGAGAAAPKKKKRRILKHEKLYVSALPAATRYSKSLMHKEQLAFLTLTPGTDFLITTSVDGVVKFWKKVAAGIEFVKQFSAHQGPVTAVSVSRDGRSFASAGVDRTVKLFDVPTFDLLSLLTLDYVPRCVCWVHPRGASLPLLAVSDAAQPVVHLYDGRGPAGAVQNGADATATTTTTTTTQPLHSLTALHRSVVTLMAYNDAYDCVVSADAGGMLEYWRPHGAFAKPDNVFRLKSATGLFAFKKAKAVPTALALSPTMQQFATFSLPDRKVRVFDFASGRLLRTYDESLRTAEDMQQAGTALQQLDVVEFGRRLAAEREVEAETPVVVVAGAEGTEGIDGAAAAAAPALRDMANVVFDESGHFVVYGSMLGIKVVNTTTNQVVRLYGADEAFRPLQLALYQGAPQRAAGGVTTVAMAASSNPLLQEAEARDPILFATGVGKQRFYLFTNQADAPKGTRDVLNERPNVAAGGRNSKKGARDAAAAAAAAAAANDAKAANGAVLHTTYGDIHIRLFPGSAPKAVENFVVHAKRGYYNDTIFHRVIRKFMIQGGDPLGDGTGGESIWGRPFADEFSSLKHDKPYTVSMANAGPNTNGSQFFITTEKTPWLDDKHTIFGRAYQGMDVIHRIENVRTYKERPEEDIKILSIDII
ncbi:peptidyl-prolyl cis trans isomerase [Niveomyces insectorum RCEF 264]|uniref:Peptidyl-prolyl cis-trans isomerase-like 1 n=1 Tax=Niveomyces insectorum RCEF 264 TaxID=1081102 RepID=A0A167VK49_9HYPO|nr:peptidyl-prolyl cis trans isomerase [Niveomyces insectorum RCEF 264]